MKIHCAHYHFGHWHHVFFRYICPESQRKSTLRTRHSHLQVLPLLIYNTALDEAYNKFVNVKEGKNADYIKELANVDPKIFGIALVTTDGQVFTKGDIASMVSIQSVSKAFVMAQIIEESGHQAVQDKIGVDATGLKFQFHSCCRRTQGQRN